MTIVLPSFTNLTDLANHPGLRMPRAATSWASCLFAVDVKTIYTKNVYVNTKKEFYWLGWSGEGSRAMRE
ncbi:hypothetical protein NL87_18310 [Salmonella enterica]|nr:hypothetical protein [Salmonella enterica]EAY5638901.1 hypothetical protein [Salmonella enterica]EBP3786582.1 hypothetical protein [Salmonella enterica subsp. enterica]EBP3796186.1 hypothetical protein [Salmonella enterica subsp. enterica]